MDWVPTWLLINLVPLIFILIVSRFFIGANRRKVEKLREDLTPQASLHGWQVETEYAKNSLQIVRWRGRDRDITWMVEETSRQHRRRDYRREADTTRWQSIDRRGPACTIFLMALPEGTPVPEARPVEGTLQALAAKAAFYALDKGLDLYFGLVIGKEVDASTFKRVTEAEPLLGGYVAFADDPAEGARVLRADVARSIARITAEPAGTGRPWILIWRHGVVVSRVGQTGAAAAVVPMVRAGVEITRALEKQL